MSIILALILSFFASPFASNGPEIKVERAERHQLVESFGAVNPCAGMGCR